MRPSPDRIRRSASAARTPHDPGSRAKRPCLSDWRLLSEIRTLVAMWADLPFTSRLDGYSEGT